MKDPDIHDTLKQVIGFVDEDGLVYCLQHNRDLNPKVVDWFEEGFDAKVRCSFCRHKLGRVFHDVLESYWSKYARFFAKEIARGRFFRDAKGFVRSNLPRTHEAYPIHPR